MKFRYLGFLLITFLFTPFVVAEEFGENEVEGDFASGLGNVAVFFLAVGAVYVVLRRLYVWSRNWPKDQQPLKDEILTQYRKWRKPLLLVHNVTMIVATIFGLIHGIFLLSEGEYRLVTGVIAVGAMILLSVSGLIMYFRFRPIWDHLPTKGFLRFIHRQWALSIVLVIGLGLHVIVH